MPYILILLILTLSFTGCEDKEQAKQHDAAIAQQAREALLAELKATQQQKENTHTSHMGIEVHNGIITIDTNKTQAYFSELNAKMASTMKKIHDDLNKGVIDAKEAGIEMNNNHISIDLNKTQNVLQEWIQQMQLLAKEFEMEAKDLDTNQSSQKM